jgi:hypothetical protein
VTVTHSEQIDKIAEALSKAQGKIEGAIKAAENPGFKRGNSASKYADLSSVWDACREHLSTNGIAVVQAPQTDGPKVTVETLLLHASGQWIRDALSATAAAAAPQPIGSAITYLRRYALAAMVGVAPADDDGEAAEGRYTPAGRRAAPAANGSAHATTKAPASPEARKADLKARMLKAGIPGAKIAEQLGEWLGRPVDGATVISVDDWMKADAGIEQSKAAGAVLAHAAASAAMGN